MQYWDMREARGRNDTLAEYEGTELDAILNGIAFGRITTSRQVQQDLVWTYDRETVPDFPVELSNSRFEYVNLTWPHCDGLIWPRG